MENMDFIGKKEKSEQGNVQEVILYFSFSFPTSPYTYTTHKNMYSHTTSIPFLFLPP
jgi:hypothetical protein